MMADIKTITLTSDMCNFDKYGNLYLKNINESIVNQAECNVIIPEIIDNQKITSIGREAFIKCSKVKSITLPESVEEIKSSAFAECTNLETINIPNNVVIIGDNAFAFCKKIKNIKLPSKLIGLGAGAFISCYGLETIKIPSTLKIIKESTFYDCRNIVTIKLPKNIKEIEGSAFGKCTNLKYINIPEDIKGLASDVFYNCTSLSQLTLPENISYINVYAFSECNNLAITYKGTQQQLNEILSKGLKDSFKFHNISFFASKVIDEYINLIINNINCNLPTINNCLEQKYILSRIDDAINNIPDINKKLQLLTIREDIETQSVDIKNDEYER